MKLVQRLCISGGLFFISCLSQANSPQNIYTTTLSIVSYVRWPTPTPVFCIAENENALKGISAIAHQRSFSIELLPIQLNQLKTTHCDAVFFHDISATQEQQFINSSLNKKLLSFSSSNSECEIGSTFCLYTSRNGNSLFKVNLDSLSRSKPHVDPRVLLLARNPE